MKKRPLLYHLLLGLMGFVWITQGCKDIFPHQYKQGQLLYNIKYQVDKRQNPIVIILPKQMTTYFKDDKTITTLEGFFGTFRMSLITRPDLDQKYVLLRVLDQKYIYQTTINGPQLGFEEMKNMKIKFVDSTFKYKDLNCKLARVYCPSISPDTFDLIYTQQIKVKYANVNTPYVKIPGVILKTRLSLMGIVMDIELEKFTPQAVDGSIFEIPDNYTPVSRTDLEKIIKSFQK